MNENKNDELRATKGSFDVGLLEVAAVDVQPRDFDFSTGYGKTWVVIVPDSSSWSYEQCHRWWSEYATDEIPSIDAYHEGDDEEKESLLDEVREKVREGLLDTEDSYAPIMDYIYPLPNYEGDASVDQTTVTNAGSCVLVDVDGEVHLGLTGGGMDLSWDICHAYVLLGYLPPFHFCDLPHYSNLKLNEKTECVLNSCIRSAEVVCKRAQSRLDSLREYKEELALAC